MGGIVDTLFGGSTSKSQQTQTSGNSNNEYLKNALGGSVSTGSNAMSTIAALLGQGGDPTAANGAFKNYLGSTGYNFMMDQGTKAITGSNAAKGLFQSGSTGKALTNFGQGMGSQYFNNYLGQLGTLINGGNQAAATIAGAGQFSNGQSTSSGHTQNGIIPGLFG